jgi:signal transduction histidine kinase
MRNLIDNALHFTPEGGRIDVGVQEDTGAAVFRVSDTGPGIAPAERERVFDRFYRGAQTQVPGSGLGLAIVRNIAARHGARVMLGDRPDGHSGLVVDVRFPAPEPDSVRRGESASSALEVPVRKREPLGSSQP